MLSINKYNFVIIKLADRRMLVDLTNGVQLNLISVIVNTYKQVTMVNKYFDDLRLKCLTIALTSAGN